jgi:hypothetical protein
MIIFKGTRSVRDDYFLQFSNETGSSIDIPVSEDVLLRFMRYFDRLSPPTNLVENQSGAESK